MILAVYRFFPFAQSVPPFLNVIVKIYDFILGMFLVLILAKIPKKALWAGLAVDLFYVFCPVRLPAFTDEEHRHFPEQLEWSGVGRAAKELLTKDPVLTG